MEIMKAWTKELDAFAKQRDKALLQGLALHSTLTVDLFILEGKSLRRSQVQVEEADE